MKARTFWRKRDSLVGNEGGEDGIGLGCVVLSAIFSSLEYGIK